MCHPAFWPSSKRLDFICHLSDFLKGKWETLMRDLIDFSLDQGKKPGSSLPLLYPDAVVR